MSLGLPPAQPSFPSRRWLLLYRGAIWYHYAPGREQTYHGEPTL